jgi:hypothetical protein
MQHTPHILIQCENVGNRRTLINIFKAKNNHLYYLTFQILNKSLNKETKIILFT